MVSGEQMLRQGNPRGALEQLTSLASTRPVTLEVATAMYLSGIAFRQIQEFNAAIRNLEDALKAARHFNDRDFEKMLTDELTATFRAIKTHRPR